MQVANNRLKTFRLPKNREITSQKAIMQWIVPMSMLE